MVVLRRLLSWSKLRLRMLDLDGRVDLRHPCTAVHVLAQLLAAQSPGAAEATRSLGSITLSGYTGPADGGFNITGFPPGVTGED
jgi:hypothetical protein